ncbi:putative glycoside/cation symporter YagG [subsurface metagenome]
MKQKSSVPTSQKVFWGLGGFAENLSNNTLLSLAYLIFGVGMGISPLYIGIALSASRILDAVTDPIMGNITDNTVSRWGRRRPYIFAGAILMSLLFASIWFTPRGGSEISQAIYLITTCSLFYVAFTVWVIPYSGLGLEMVTDYDERTRLMTFRVIPSFIVGVLIASLYAITLKSEWWGGDEVVGARYVGTIIAGLILITGILPSIYCKERYAQKKQEKIDLRSAILFTLKDKAFLLLVGSVFFVFVALFYMIPLLTYINLYHVCEGDKILTGRLGVFTGPSQAITQILATAAIGFFAKYFDKKHVLITGLLIGILGYLSSWFLFTPGNPYLAILPPVIINIGLCACWVLNGSFSADICDYDELKTGRRREGMYSAVFGFLNKAAIALVMLVSSWVLVRLGFEGEDLQPTTQQLFTLRWTYIVIPTVSMIGAILCMWHYPLTKKKVAEIQKELEIRRSKTDSE